jgi:hypothetical protein
MRSHTKTTIGFISTWPVYQGTTIARYAHSLIQGISATATEHRWFDLVLDELTKEARNIWIERGTSRNSKIVNRRGRLRSVPTANGKK